MQHENNGFEKWVSNGPTKIDIWRFSSAPVWDLGTAWKIPDYLLFLKRKVLVKLGSFASVSWYSQKILLQCSIQQSKLKILIFSKNPACQLLELAPNRGNHSRLSYGVCAFASGEGGPGFWAWKWPSFFNIWKIMKVRYNPHKLSESGWRETWWTNSKQLCMRRISLICLSTGCWTDELHVEDLLADT